MNDFATRKGAIPLKPASRRRPTQAEAEEAVRTLIAWAGDDPAREGLKETPRRVTGAFEEYFSGYRLDPSEALSKTFDETNGQGARPENADHEHRQQAMDHLG